MISFFIPEERSMEWWLRRIRINSTQSSVKGRLNKSGYYVQSAEGEAEVFHSSNYTSFRQSYLSSFPSASVMMYALLSLHRPITMVLQIPALGWDRGLITERADRGHRIGILNSYRSGLGARSHPHAQPRLGPPGTFTDSAASWM